MKTISTANPIKNDKNYGSFIYAIFYIERREMCLGISNLQYFGLSSYAKLIACSVEISHHHC